MSYTAQDIETLDFRTAIRSRIEMYLGSADNQGVLQAIREIITNSIDEATMGYGKEIKVELYPNNKVKVSDKGRGVPFGKRNDGTEALEAVYTMPHSGGKFNEKVYQNVAGLNGIGAKGTALSADYFRVTSHRGAEKATLILEKGIKKSFKVEKNLDSSTGTTVEFIPSQEVFKLEEIKISFEEIEKMCEAWSYLSKGIKFTLYNIETKEVVTYESKDGLVDLIKNNITNPIMKRPLHIFYKEKDVEAEIAMEWTSNRKEEWYVFTNGLENSEGGTSLTGIRSSLTNFFKKRIKNYTADMARTGLFYVVQCKIPNPSFANQTKTKVNNSELRGICQKATTQMLEEFEKRNPKEFKEILDMMTRELKAEHAAEKARQAILSHEKEFKKNQKKKILHADKLRDARKLGQDSILLCVEGLSAGGSMSIGRDPNKYGILMLRGKAKNLLNCKIEDGLENEEVKLMLQALGIPYGAQYNPNKLRYGKLAIATDADVDGSHIGLLILAMIHVLMPEFIKENRMYWLRTPIYKVSNGKKDYFYYTEEEFKNHPNGSIVKYKG